MPTGSRTARRIDPQQLDQRWIDAHGNVIDEEDRGLGYDVRTLVDRRRLLGLFGGVSAAALLAACGSSSEAAGSPPGSSTGSPPGSSSGSSEGSSAGLTEVPDETAGPYPADGSNGVNVLDDSGIVRKDITSSFGSSTTTAQGVPLTVRLTVRDAATGDPLTGAAVYLWHCTADGNYSLYSPGFENENFLRGVQQVDAGGTATFTTIFPGCYRGRWPHLHFEVYRSPDDATSSGPIVKTSQIALPAQACTAVYATAGYAASVPNLAGVSLATDRIFREDGAVHQLASITGAPGSGYTAALTIGV